MSLLNELKSVDEELRAASNRRDRLRKHSNKHGKEAEIRAAKIKKATELLEKNRDQTAENIAQWTDELTMHEEMQTKCDALLEAAEVAVNVRLDELGAL